MPAVIYSEVRDNTLSREGRQHLFTGALSDNLQPPSLVRPDNVENGR